MKQKLLYLVSLSFFLCMIFGTNNAFAQDGSVSGQISDNLDGSFLPGVSIVIKGTTTGTITDMDGKFTLKIKEASTLVISFIGYDIKEVQATPGQTIDLKLTVKSTNLDEVLVIGYGTVKKSDATGSVSSVSSKDFNKGAITSPQDLLVGKSAGVVITNAGGAPGSKSTIRIRGGSSLNASNDPLIVVDGFALDNNVVGGLSNGLSSINPNDIETFTVLKDASATAIYGSRASNGVILITTKKGKSGANSLKVSYNGNVSIGSLIKKVDVLTGDEIRALVAERVKSGKLTEAAFDRVGNANTDWQGEVYRTSISSDHNISLTGSYAKMPYRASLGYTNQDGIIKSTNMQRTTLALGVDPSFLDDHIKIGVNIKAMNIKNSFDPGVVGDAVGFDPSQPVMNGNTKYGGYTSWTDKLDVNGTPNSIATINPALKINFADDKSSVNRMIANTSIDYKFHGFTDLRATMNMGFDFTKSEGHKNISPMNPADGRNPENSVTSYTNTNRTTAFSFNLTYDKQLDAIESKITAMAGYDYQHFFRDGYNINASWDNTKTGSKMFKNENFLVSFLGRLNYTLLDRYLLTLTMRNDGSSKFGPDNRWGLFPSAALAWKVNNESFLKDVKVVTELKLRAGYGVTGQEDIAGQYYPAIATYAYSKSGAGVTMGNTEYRTLRPNPYDVNIKWEQTETKNIGIDFGFLKERITGSFDVYSRLTSNLLNQTPVAGGTNFSNRIFTNVGSMENTGYEFVLNLRPITTKDMSWDLGFNIAHNENKITKLTASSDPNFKGIEWGDDIAGGIGRKGQIVNIGFPINTFNLLQQVYDAKGNPVEGLYVDRTGKGPGSLNSLENRYYGKTPAPKYTIGLSSKFSYKDFDASFSSRLNIDNYVYNNVYAGSSSLLSLYDQSGYVRNLNKVVFDTKFEEQGNSSASDYYIENASFFKLDNITLGYNFTKLLKDKLKVHATFTVQNVLTVTKYKGLDPELENGIDNNIYPRARTFIVGVGIDF